MTENVEKHPVIVKWICTKCKSNNTDKNEHRGFNEPDFGVCKYCDYVIGEERKKIIYEKSRDISGYHYAVK